MASTVAPQPEPVKASEIDQARATLNRGFRQLASLVNAAEKPPPTQTGDGTYLKGDPDLAEKIGSGLETASRLGLPDLETLVQVGEKQMTGSLWNDKEYLMERLIQTAAQFPDDSAAGKKITDGFLAALYNDLQHPPIS
jgi:linoleate 10R-lipoxygenase